MERPLPRRRAIGQRRASKTREWRIAHSEAWSRSLNQRDAKAVEGPAAMADFRCECWQQQCTQRLPLSGEEWRMVRAQRNRFAVAPGHVAANFEAVIKEFPHFWMVEKFGEAGEVAKRLGR
jgi:hypothetical protein